jgi:HK97 family phage portal protein
MTTWAEVQEKIKIPGSVVLTQYQAECNAKRLKVSNSTGRRGSELHEWLTGGLSNAGVAVNEKSVRHLAVVNACISLIGGAVASMPLHSYNRGTGENRERFTDDITYMLNESPMANWIASSFWQYIMQSKLLHGDGFARIHRASRLSPRIVGIEPINPVKIQKIEIVNGLLIYSYLNSKNEIITLDQGDILHFPSDGFDGVRSPSALQTSLRNAAGTALAADQYSARFFNNNARPDYFLSTEGDMMPDAIENLKRELADSYGGTFNAHRPGILTGGLKLEQITMPHEDAQLLATRSFQIEEIARAFNVAPFLIGHNEKTTTLGSGIEQLGRFFVQYTLLRHLNNIRQECTRKLWPRNANNFVEHSTAALERGDLKTRFESYRIAIGRAGEPGFMTVNQVRKLENWPALEGGDNLNYGVTNGEEISKTAS